MRAQAPASIPAVPACSPVRFAESTPIRIAVFRALQLGDLLCAVPALRALRAALPRAHITLIGLPWAHEFAWRFAHYVDSFLPFPGGSGLPERTATPAEEAQFLRRARAARFDWALQLHGSGEQSNAIVAALGAPNTAGFVPTGQASPDPRRFLPYPSEESEVRRPLRLLEHLGIATQDGAMEFPISPREWQAAGRLRERFGLRPRHYACLHAGARAASRRWAPEKFARVGDALASRGLHVVLTGTREEEALGRAVAKSMRAASVNLVGQTTTGALGALLTGARVLVCNDTGVSHLAAALSVSSVVIYLDSSPQRWAPSDVERHRRVVRRGGEDVSVSDVWREVATLL